MKVLFAVSNENISEAIIKKYPKEYREILSYKNVYYFNAILKEIQKDKSYDRIVISEDLEPFVNTNHDSIDNFIFEHLDKISDEAHDNEGNETSIILICSERRTPGSNILNKLFSIGVYNAVMGTDRNLSELCRLINRPRTKKEAKIYYRIDQATYDPVVENEVNETEIQNILTHFKKLGKNTERYADSFNNIAAQYTDEQLRIIINVLPIKVKAVLEAESPKYQSLMGSSGEGTKIKPVTLEPGIKVNTIGKTTQINGPIVIPSSVKKVQPRAVTTSANVGQKQVQKVPAQSQKPTTQPQKTVAKTQNTVNQPQKVNSGVNVNKVQSNANVADGVKNAQKVVTSARNTVTQKTATQQINNTAQVQKPNIPVQNKQVQQNTVSETNVKAKNSVEVLNNVVTESEDITEEKRGRGRPKKVISNVETEKPKGKRGRPRKNPTEEVEEIEVADLNELLNPIGNAENIDETDDGVLPGLEDDSADDGILPGLDNEESFEVEDNGILPGMEEETEEDDGVLPGLEDDSADDGILPGLDNEENFEVEDNGILPGMEEETEEDDGTLPGLEDDSADEGVLPGLDEDSVLENGGDEVDVNSLLAGLDDDSVLPGVDNDFENNNIVDEENPSLDDIQDDEETMLPGMGFEDTSSNSASYSSNYNAEPQKTGIINSVKPKIDYSMSNLNSLLSKDKKIVAFLGTTKNGTSFLVNNLALVLSQMGINVSILDMTQNRNSYYIFTDSREELRNIAYTSIGKLENGYAEGIKVNKNFTVYTALPADGIVYENAEPILSTLIQNHSVVLIDCDFETPPAYFASAQEIYLVQSMDILTIQPLTAFLRELKFKGAWEPEKARVVINKETKVKGLNGKMIIAGMSRYNGPDMSVMTDLFNRDMVKACSIPFDERVYAKYLETMATCKLSLAGYSKPFMQKLQILAEMVYPSLNSKKTYGPMDNANIPQNNTNVFSNNTNNTLNQMKNKY